MIDKTPILHVRLLIPKEPNAVVPRTVRVGLLLLLLLFFFCFFILPSYLRIRVEEGLS